jgi:heat shock protein HslJ
VVINAFIITVSAPTVTQPTCTTPTGTIVVDATTSTGTLEYSIDNGITYQATNTFSGLAAGNYTIKVNEQSSSCTETYSSNPVVINALINYNTQIYVKTGATAGSNDGSSWANAFLNLQDAIDANCNNVDIWVAAGTYLPTDAPDGTTSTGPADRNNTFHLATDMKIYGGFAGTETLLSARDAATNITILSGDFDSDDGVTGSGSTFAITGNTENAYHVMITANLTAAAVIDGFTIKGGNANGSGNIVYQSKTYENNYGGGMFNDSSSPTITNTTFSYNTAYNGGGMFNDTSDPIITSTTFSYNTADYFGGGMCNEFSSSPTITNTTFSYNTADYFGGGMRNYYRSSPTITNTTFLHNTADEGGGGMFNDSSSPTITNTTFSYNTASNSGGGMYNSYGSSPIITNSIFWDNLKNSSNSALGADIEDVSSSSPTVSYCLTQTYNGGTRIISNKNPLFVDAANGGFSLMGCSPAINTGTTVTHTTDALGNAFVGIVDMGAYEYQGNPYTTAIYVDKSAITGNNDGSSWADAYTNLQDAIDHQCVGGEIWVAAGTYLPTKDHAGNSMPADNQEKNFHLATDMKIYGGFAGTETLLSARDAATNITILSGDFDSDDGVTGSGSTFAITGNTENAYHVMITANLTAAAVIDGFTIKGGNANGSGNIVYQSKTYENNYGGGMFNDSSSPTITNTTFSYNTAYNGGGMFNDTSDPIITSTTFSYNTADYFGGGMCNEFSSSPTITNTTFSYNTADYFGGGMRNYYRSSPTITNTTFLHNTADEGGGGMFNDSSSPTITNTTFSYNTASNSGGGMYNSYGSSPIITNSIFWENLKNSSNSALGADIEDVSSSSPTVSYCLTQTYNGGTGIISNKNPFFVDAMNGDFSLQNCSPAINAGIAVSHITDILGNPHVGIVDMGAYEFKELDPITITANITHGTNPNYSGVPSITSEGAILNTNNAVFKAQNYIELLPGFSVAPAPEQATVFRAEIEGCE